MDDNNTDIEPYPGAFVSLPWGEEYNPYDYELQLQAWRRVVAEAEAAPPRRRAGGAGRRRPGRRGRHPAA